MMKTWIEELMLNIGRGFLYLIGWKPQAQRVYEQLKRLSPDWPQISDKAIAAIESLSDAFIASQITLGAVHQQIEPYQPQPEYEGMQFAQADWKPEE
jgi:hypothetical protein